MRLSQNILRGAAFILAIACFSSGSFAQGTIQQTGPVVPFHGPVWMGNGQQGDAGAASGFSPQGTAGAGLSEQLKVMRGNGTPPYSGTGTGPLGTNDCNYDAPVTNATGYHFLCLSPNAAGGGLIYYGYGGGASPLPFQFDINGTFYVVPGTATPGTGIVIASGTAYQAVPNIETYAWKSAASGTKTLTLYACGTNTAWYKVAVADDIGTMGTAGNAGVVLPFGTNTILTAASFVLNTSKTTASFQCDGLGNWIAR